MQIARLNTAGVSRMQRRNMALRLEDKGLAVKMPFFKKKISAFYIVVNLIEMNALIVRPLYKKQIN